MPEMMMTRLYELMVILYAISIVFYFIDYVYKHVKARKIAFRIISVVWSLQSIFLILYIMEMKRFPILTFFEGLYVYAWLLTSLSIVLHCIARVDLPVVLINVLGFIFMTIHMFGPNEGDLVVQASVSEILMIHIGFAIVSYAVFSLSFVFSVLYLLVYRILKKKKFDGLWTRLPSLQQTSDWMSNSLLVGVPLLCISLILGLEWALLTVDGFSLMDIKIIGSFIIVLVYFAILILHRSGKLVGPTYAWVHIYSFLIVVVNFFLGTKLSQFHLWY